MASQRKVENHFNQLQHETVHAAVPTTSEASKAPCSLTIPADKLLFNPVIAQRSVSTSSADPLTIPLVS